MTKLNLWQNLNYDTSTFMREKKKTFNGFFSMSFLTPWQPMRCSQGRILRFFQCFVVKLDRVALLMTDPPRLAPPPCTITPPPLGAFKLKKNKKIKNPGSRVGEGGGRGWTFPQNFRSLTALVWETDCFEDILTNHCQINYWVITKLFIGQPRLLRVCQIC